ncbi:hypothetical protein MTO96_035890 [Rhipicephalus appendiculatus]
MRVYISVAATADRVENVLAEFASFGTGQLEAASKLIAAVVVLIIVVGVIFWWRNANRLRIQWSEYKEGDGGLELERRCVLEMGFDSPGSEPRNNRNVSAPALPSTEVRVEDHA